MMLGHMTMIMGHMTIIMGHMTMMIRSVRKFIKVCLINACNKCEGITKIVVLVPHNDVVGVT